MIRIIPYQPKYEDDVSRLVLNIQQNEFGLSVTAEEQPDLRAIEEFYITPGGNFWLALDGEKLVGTIALINRGNGIGVLRKMFVAADYRGSPHRIATQLMETLLNWAQAQGIHDIYLGTADILQAAMKFYEKSGFRPFPETNLPETVAAIKMRLDTHYYAITLNKLEKRA